MVLFRLYTFSFLNLTPCRSNRIDQRRRPCRTAYTVHMCSLGVEDVFYGYDHSKYLSVQIPFGHLLKLDIPIQNFSTKVGAAVPHICTRHSRLSWSENVMLIYKISIYVCAACIQVLYVYDDIMGERIYISALDYDPFSMAMISSRADVFFFLSSSSSLIVYRDVGAVENRRHSIHKWRFEIASMPPMQCRLWRGKKKDSPQL